MLTTRFSQQLTTWRKSVVRSWRIFFVRSSFDNFFSSVRHLCHQSHQESSEVVTSRPESSLRQKKFVTCVSCRPWFQPTQRRRGRGQTLHRSHHCQPKWWDHIHWPNRKFSNMILTWKKKYVCGIWVQRQFYSSESNKRSDKQLTSWGLHQRVQLLHNQRV